MPTRPLLVALSLLPSLAIGHERENVAYSVHPAPTADALSVTFSSFWESRYYLEGRDVLDGDSILSNTLEFQWDSFSAGIWYGNSTEQHYDELHATLLYHHSFGETLEAYLGYNHVRFPHDDGHHDHEIHTGLSWSGCPMGIEWAVDAYHSMEAGGFFVESSGSYGWELSDKLSASLTGIFGMNQGYVADGHDGANHIAASIGLSYALTDSLTIGAHGTYSWGIDRKAGAADDASLKDFFHAGIGLELSF